MIDFDSLVIGPSMAPFAEPVLYTPLGGATFGISGVYDAAYVAVAPLGGVDSTDFGTPSNITAARPVLGVQLSKFPTGIAPAQGDGLVIDASGTAYEVMEVQSDSHGWALLLLNVA